MPPIPPPSTGTSVGFDVVRSGSSASTGNAGTLIPAVQTGRHGTALGLRWTHILLCSTAVDVRDGYNAQVNGGITGSPDNVLILGTKFYVVFVEKAGDELTLDDPNLKAFFGSAKITPE